MKIYEKPTAEIRRLDDRGADIIAASTVSDPYDFTQKSSAKQFGGIDGDFEPMK